MPSLLDIAPPEVSAETLTIRGTPLTVKGVSILRMAQLVRRYPEFAKQMASLALTDPGEAWTSLPVEMIPAIISAGLVGSPEETSEALVRERLTDNEMLEVLNVIMRLTNPPASGPLSNGQVGAVVVPSGEDPDMNTAKPSTS